MSDEKDFDLADVFNDDAMPDETAPDHQELDKEQNLTPDGDSSLEESPEHIQDAPKNDIPDEKSRIAELESKLREYETKAVPIEVKPEVIPEDILDSPQRLAEYMQERITLETIRLKVAMSAEMMKDKHEDYAERVTEFQKLAEQNPSLYEQMARAANPAAFAYNHAKSHKEIELYKDPNFREKLKQDIRAEILAEMGNGNLKIPVKIPASVSRSTATKTNSVQAQSFDLKSTDEFFQ